jgi:hypothetical protein
VAPGIVDPDLGSATLQATVNARHRAVRQADGILLRAAEQRLPLRQREEPPLSQLGRLYQDKVGSRVRFRMRFRR